MRGLRRIGWVEWTRFVGKHLIAVSQRLGVCGFDHLGTEDAVIGYGGRNKDSLPPIAGMFFIGDHMGEQPLGRLIGDEWNSIL